MPLGNTTFAEIQIVGGDFQSNIFLSLGRVSLLCNGSYSEMNYCSAKLLAKTTNGSNNPLVEDRG